MIHDLRPYPAMKDSGVPWLGLVPEHWMTASLGSLTSARSERNQPDLPLLSVVREKGVIPRNRESKEDNHNFIPDDLSNYKVVRTGDLVVNKMKAWQGSMGLAPMDGIVSPAYFVFEFDMANRRFGQALLRSPTYVSFFAQASDGVRIGQWDLSVEGMKRIPVLVPPPPEQAAIVRFLDHADRRIRKAIAAKQRLIRLLQEQKQVIIHQAVTRGLDPDVKLKPSGVDWLGDVPEGWEVKRLKSLVSSITSGSRGWSNFAADTGSLFIRIGNLTRASIDLDMSDDLRIQLPDYALAEAARTKIKANDILLSITAFIGSVAVVPDHLEEAYVSQHVACCRPLNDAGDSRWIAYVLLSPIGQTHGKISMYGGTKQGLSLDDVKNYLVVMPPRDEQENLVAWIEKEILNVNTQIGRAQSEISLLREYRTRLIADVVTGKLDVRAAAARLPEPEQDALPEELEGGEAEDNEPEADEREAELVEA